jgi:hypothetical protein
MTILQDTPQDPLVVPTARVLVLLVEFSSRRPEGLTVADISRIDFLLRHPPLLARLATEAGKPLEPALTPTQSERLIVEQVAMRLRYGPWDERYRLVVGRLIALELVRPSGDLVSFAPTSAARPVVASLRAHGWERTARHAAAAARLLGLEDVTHTVHRLAAV